MTTHVDPQTRDQHRTSVTTELRQSLPAGRAVALVQQDDALVLLASSLHVSEQALTECAEILRQLVDKA